MGTRRMLVVLAHPDDESFPLGGTLAKYAAEGVEITLACATKGEAGIPGLPKEETARVRERELRAAADVLGLSDVRFLGWQDGELAKVDARIVVQQLVAIVREIQPQVVITFGPDGISGHPDHVMVHQTATLAFDRAGIPARLFYIAPSEATLQGCGVIPPRETTSSPVAAIDVGEQLVTKVKAMQCYVSQNPPYPGSPEEETRRLTCHEYFVLARPVVDEINLSDLFEPLGQVVA